MDEPKELPLKRFNPKVMLENIDCIRDMIQRIRQKEGGIGSAEDELSLCRAIQDLDLLVDIADGLKAAYDTLQSKFDTVSAAVLALQNQKESLTGTYKRMIQERDERIKELETTLGIRPKTTEAEPEDTDADTE